MAVVGIDLGNLASKVSCRSLLRRLLLTQSQIGVARHRGIDIITNEVSNRATPCVISSTLTDRALTPDDSVL